MIFWAPGPIRGLVNLVESIPDELITVAVESYADFVSSVATLDLSSRVVGPGRGLDGEERAAILTIYRALRTCPDDFPAAGTTEPTFITDASLRSDLHRDIGEVNRAVKNGEWKAATVLAGSVVEAMLYWALQQKPPTELTAAAAPLGYNSARLDRWELYQLIEVAHAMNLICAQTKAAADLCRNYRNLVHPGVAKRRATKCDRGTAHFGVGAIEAVVSDLI